MLIIIRLLRHWWGYLLRETLTDSPLPFRSSQHSSDFLSPTRTPWTFPGTEIRKNDFLMIVYTRGVHVYLERDDVGAFQPITSHPLSLLNAWLNRWNQECFLLDCNKNLQPHQPRVHKFSPPWVFFAVTVIILQFTRFQYILLSIAFLSRALVLLKFSYKMHSGAVKHWPQHSWTSCILLEEFSWNFNRSEALLLLRVEQSARVQVSACLAWQRPVQVSESFPGVRCLLF